MTNPGFSKRITLLRKENGYSQKYAASQLDVSQALLSHYEKGIRECGLAFLVRCADFYNVSCDYLLGRSPEKSGNTIKVEDLPETDNTGKSNQGKFLMPILNKKLMVNSLGIIFDLLARTENKSFINEASTYLMIPLYRIFRLIYGANNKNEMDLFTIPEEVSSSLILAESAHADAAMLGCLFNLKHDGYDILTESGRPLISSSSIEEAYPQQATSLFNLIQNVENKIQNRKTK